MTRKSRREIESKVEDLAPSGRNDVREWVNEQLQDCLPDTDTDTTQMAEYAIISSDGTVIQEPDHTGEVCIWQSAGDGGMEIWVNESDVPEWIDAEADLPVVK